MENIIKLETIQEYNRLLGAETLHPLVSVTDFSTLQSLKHCRKNFIAVCFNMVVTNTITKMVR